MVTKLDRELEQLRSMPRIELVERWQAAYGCPPPVGARRELLMYAAGWHIQVKRLGGLSGDVRRMLRREMERVRREFQVGQPQSGGDEHDDIHPLIVSSGGQAGGLSNSDGRLPVPEPPAERRKLVPGARLLRDWNGKTHAIDVVESGYLYEGKIYRSLSAIARRITSAHWSGPRFFGL